MAFRSIIPVIMAKTERQDLLLDLFQCEFVILPHPNIFFHLLILFRWDMYRAVIMMCKTSCNQGSISFVCFYLFPARRF